MSCVEDTVAFIKSGMEHYLLQSKSAAFLTMLAQCRKVARTKANILLIGESGSGKEIAAKYIHAHSPRSSANFVAVNCTALSEALLESELFGHEQGAFTGAIKVKPGKFETADGGTLFLDEVGELSMRTQAKLLRVLETKSTERLGSVSRKFIDFRLVSATNKDLIHAIVAGNYREDFFYRVSSIVIRVPSLKERREDLDALITFFLLQSQHDNDIKIHKIDSDAKKFLYSYDYPGNIRELKSIIDRMVVLSHNGIINKDGIPLLFDIRKSCPPLTRNYVEVVPFRQFKRDSEAQYLEWAIRENSGNVSQTAARLEISARHLFAKIREYGINVRE